MKRRSWMIAGGALVALVLVGALSAVAVHAQTPTPPTAPDGTTLTNGRGPHGPRALSQAELDAAAKVLGITADDLSAQLASGSTLDQIATELETAVGQSPSPEKLREATLPVLQRIIATHKRVVFNGDSYSAEWHAEAERRGLPHLRDCVSAIPALGSPDSRASSSVSHSTVPRKLSRVIAI